FLEFSDPGPHRRSHLLEWLPTVTIRHDQNRSIDFFGRYRWCRREAFHARVNRKANRHQLLALCCPGSGARRELELKPLSGQLYGVSIERKQELDGAARYVADLKVRWKSRWQRRPTCLLLDIQEGEDCLKVKRYLSPVVAAHRWQRPSDKLCQHVMKPGLS